jgi:hypothetical protein
LKTRSDPRQPFSRFLDFSRSRLAHVRQALVGCCHRFSVFCQSYAALHRQRIPLGNVGDGSLRQEAWYGGAVLDVKDYSVFDQSPKRLSRKRMRKIDSYRKGDVEIESDPSLHDLLGSSGIVRQHLSDVKPSSSKPNEMHAGLTCITVYHKGQSRFGQCALSMVRLSDEVAADGGDFRVEWIIINTDPLLSDSRLLSLMPATFFDRVAVIPGKELDVVAGLNHATSIASNEWLLFLGCDDELTIHAPKILSHYWQKFPFCRYILPAAEDIDERARTLCIRRHPLPPTLLFDLDLTADRVVVIRRDLLTELQNFDGGFEGVEQFDIALRAAASEPLLLIPEVMSRHTLPGYGSTDDERRHRARRLRAVRSMFLRRLLAENLDPGQRSLWPQSPRGFCIVRTQGRRPPLLLAAIQSILLQHVSTVPCVVVHGDETVYRQVESQLADVRHSITLLHASRTDQKRGEACNVALSYLVQHKDKYDFFCFLDDDDHLLPNFSERLTSAAAFAGSDVAVGLTNAISGAGVKQRMHGLLPISLLTMSNFIPINSYIVRTSALIETEARFDTTLHYLEDWDFLLQFLEGGVRFVPVYETVAEFRILGDGSRKKKSDPEEYKRCRAQVLERGRHIRSKMSPSVFWQDVLDFPEEQVPFIKQQKLDSLLKAKNAFTEPRH